MENCNDLINRRKAFEYFVTLWECIGTIIDRDEWEDVCMTTANEIPSAQSEIIRCKDCKWSDWYDVDGHKYCYCIETGASGRTADDFCSYAEREMDGSD